MLMRWSARVGFASPLSWSLNDVPALVRGAIPADPLALGVHCVFELLDLVLIPRGLRFSPSSEDDRSLWLTGYQRNPA